MVLVVYAGPTQQGEALIRVGTAGRGVSPTDDPRSPRRNSESFRVRADVVTRRQP
jgi:hypothetical protein